jgi:hypothetical protein
MQRKRSARATSAIAEPEFGEGRLNVASWPIAMPRDLICRPAATICNETPQ